MGLVCFCSVGMFLSMTNLGAGGLNNIHLTNIANAVLYAMFAVSGELLASYLELTGRSRFWVSHLICRHEVVAPHS